MKHLMLSAAALALFATPAFAADLVQAQPPSIIAPVSAVDWTGLYVGAMGGLGTGDSSLQLGPSGGPSFIDITATNGGMFAGVQIGGDYQTGQFVFGGVADLAITNIGTTISAGPVDDTPFAEIKSRVDYLATLRARAGVSFDNALAYVHGGLAVGHVTPSVSLGDSLMPGIEANTQAGYTVGVGLQYRLTDNVSLQTEYAFTDLGRATVYDDGDLGQATLATRFHTVKAGVNFHF